MQKKRLDGGYGWAIVFAHFMVGSCVFGTLKSSGVMFVYFKEEYNATYASTATISLTQRLSETSTALIFSFLAERFGSRPVMYFGGVLLVVGAFLSAYAKSIVQLILTFGLPVGIGNSMLIYPGAQMIPKYFDKKLALAMGLALSGGSFGPLVFPFLIRYSIPIYGLSGSFWILAAVYLHVFISATIMRPPPSLLNQESREVALVTCNGNIDKSTTNGHVPGEVKIQQQQQRNEKPSFKSNWQAYKSCFRSVSLLLFYFAYMTATVSATNFLAYQQAHAKDRGISDPTLLALLASIWGVCEVISKICFAFVLQSGVILPYRLNQLSLVLMSAVLLVYPTIHSYWMIACCSGILAFLWSSIVVCIVPTLRLVVGIELCSPALGMMCLPIFLAYTSVQISGFVRDYTGTFVFVYYACVVTLFLGILALELIAWREKKSIVHKILSQLQRSYIENKSKLGSEIRVITS